MTEPKTALLKIAKAPQTLRDIVQERMREAIISGHFAPGERLVERPLCEQLGVSRTVIRETIRFLEAEGLVELVPNRGPTVASLDWDQARQIYNIRRQLEGSAAAACAEMHDAACAKSLGEALKRIGETTQTGEWSELRKTTTRFYEIIFDAAGHSVAWDIVQRLNGRISRLRALTLSATDRPVSGLTHMTAIYDAIISRNPDAARTAVHRHIDDASHTAQRYLKAETGPDHA
jgi:GntR family transcriptional regulator, trigonelline degradation regulator